MFLIRWTILGLLLAVLTITCVAQDKTTGAIKGKVRVERGSPSGVAVILVQGDHEVSRTVTDKKGDFLLSRIGPGTYSVKFRKAGLAVVPLMKSPSGRDRPEGWVIACI